jgi:PucR family transcriptional regulator, purine catabolism regulatory protein
MLTIKEAMKINPLRKTRLVGGKKGLNNVIKSVTVMEVPDIVHWIKGGEFVITRFYFTKNVKLQLDILYELKKYELKKWNASGLAIKINKGSCIREELVRAANEINFPLIEVPENITYLDIMTPLNHKIFEIEQYYNLVEEYIKSIIFHTYKNIENIIDRGKSLGYNLEKGFIYTICIDISNLILKEKYNSIYVKNNIHEFINNILDELKIKNRIINYAVIRNINDVTVFIQIENKQNCKKIGKYVLGSILKYISINYKKNDISIGIGNVLQGISGIEKGYEESKYAIKIGRVIYCEKNYYFYKDVELYSIFYKNYFNDISSFARFILGELVEDKELMDTISMYYECNESILNTSSKLFIHKNTLKYRLKNIEKITGLNIKNIDDKVKLYFGVIAYKIWKGKKRN